MRKNHIRRFYPVSSPIFNAVYYNSKDADIRAEFFVKIAIVIKAKI